MAYSIRYIFSAQQALRFSVKFLNSTPDIRAMCLWWFSRSEAVLDRLITNSTLYTMQWHVTRRRVNLDKYFPQWTTRITLMVFNTGYDKLSCLRWDKEDSLRGCIVSALTVVVVYICSNTVQSNSVLHISRELQMHDGVIIWIYFAHCWPYVRGMH